MYEEDIRSREHVKHLGQIITYNLDEGKECDLKRSDLIWRFNYMISQYYCLSSDIKTKLFTTYCVHLYGASSWNLSDPHITKYKTAWNICIRKLWNLDNKTHRKILPVIAGTMPVWYSICYRFIALYNAMTKASNSLVKNVIDNVRLCRRSLTSRNIEVVQELHNSNTNHNVSELEYPVYIPDTDVQADALVVRELSLVRQGVMTLQGLNEIDIYTLINHICLA